MKRLHTHSQHFLRSPATAQGLLRRSSIKKGSTVYDLGAGSGVISSVLAKQTSKVIAVEVEPDTLEILKRNMAPYTNVAILRKDILTLEFQKEPYAIFANIPFSISSPLVARLIELTNKPEVACLIVQKQFGYKLQSNTPGQFTSQLGMLVGAQYTVTVLKNLRKTDYWPHPAVDTVCIELKKRRTPLIESSRFAAYKKFTEDCFSDPKKLAVMPLHIIGIKPGASPSRLTLDQWLLLFHSQNRY